MNILVCLKQVPSSTNIIFDDVTGRIKRNSNEVMMNPADLYAIETSLKIKEKLGGNVIAITMGPLSAKEVILEAISLGVDNGYVISDKKFASSDLLTTSHTLEQGIKSLGNFDLVICGRESLDGSTGSLAGELGEKLKVPVLHNISQIHNISENDIEVTSVVDDSLEKLKVKLPVLLSVSENIYEPRFPNYLDLIKSEEMDIKILSIDNFEDKNEENYGAKGSHSSINKVFKKENTMNSNNFDSLNSEKEKEIWSGSSEELSKKLENKLKAMKFL